nr:MAG TPA: hypothetical protein [Bacteriophage sp.]
MHTLSIFKDTICIQYIDICFCIYIINNKPFIFFKKHIISNKPIFLLKLKYYHDIQCI